MPHHASDDWGIPLRNTVDTVDSTGSTGPGLSRLRVLVQSAAFKVLALALCCWHQGPDPVGLDAWGGFYKWGYPKMVDF